MLAWFMLIVLFETYVLDGYLVISIQIYAFGDLSFVSGNHAPTQPAGPPKIIDAASMPEKIWVQ
jgi:hypothetical protein